MRSFTPAMAAAALGLLTFGGSVTASVFYRRPAPFNQQLALQIADAMNQTNNVIPGGSPFFYLDDPADHLFTIASISMTPNPCMIGLPCAVEMRGTFHEDLSSVELDFDIEVRLKNGQSAKIIAVRDDLCGWVDLKQSDRSDCPPRKGAATLSASMSLARGFIMEATYWLDVKLTSRARTLTHIGAMIKLVDADTVISLPNTATS